MTDSTPAITWRGRILATIFGFIVLVGSAEIGLRFFATHWQDFDSNRFMQLVAMPGRPLLIIGTPGFDGWFAQNNGDFRHSIRINADGLRNDEPTSAAHGRIWVVGDSMTFGWGVAREHGFSEVLARELNEKTYNVAAPGANVCGYQTLVSRMPGDARPKAVVLGLVLENDVFPRYDCSSPPLLGDPGLTTGRPDSLASLLGWVKRWLTAKSAIYNVAVPAIKRIEALNALLIRVGLIKPEHGYKRFFEENQIGDVVRETAREIDGVRKLLPAGSPLVVLLIPARFEIKNDDPIYRRMRLEMRDELTRLAIPSVDVFDDFKVAGFAPTHFAHDGHWSPKGHEIAGRALTRWFKAHP